MIKVSAALIRQLNRAFIFYEYIYVRYKFVQPNFSIQLFVQNKMFKIQ